jgi:hypothetical protein
VGWLRQGLGLAAGRRCGVRSVAGAGRCRWAWLHRHGQPNPAGITPQSMGRHRAANAAAEALPRSLSARLITIRELSDSGLTCPALITPSGAALLAAAAAGLPCWWVGAPGRAGGGGRPGAGAPPAQAEAPSPSLPRPAPRRPGLPPAAAAGVGRRHPQRGASSSPRVGDPTRSRDPKTVLALPRKSSKKCKGGLDLFAANFSRVGYVVGRSG